MDPTFEQARAFFLEGVADYEAGRFEQAERKFAASLALVPGRASVLTNLGAARLKLGRVEEALALLDEALAQEPDNAQAQGHRGAALAELGRHGEALEALDRTIALQTSNAAAWSLRGSVLKDLGRFYDAAASFEQAIALGADPELTGYCLASLKGEAVPATAPRGYVQALFDGYAPQFEAHLEQLHYDAPRVLAARLAGRLYATALDLGCGTGLCARALQPLCGAIDGIDLSSRMLDKAQESGAYALLEQADAADYLHATHRRYDLVIAADVFVYVGVLEPVFAGVARVLRAGGSFCFTVEEAGEGEGPVVLRPSLRYAHSEASLRALAEAHGFGVDAVERRPVREDQGRPIPGLFVWLRKDGAAGAAGEVPAS